MNYYAFIGEGGRENGAYRLHIGKAVEGWVFALCEHTRFRDDSDGVAPPPLMSGIKLRSWGAWEAILELSGVEIEDETERPISLDVLREIVTGRYHPSGKLSCKTSRKVSVRKTPHDEPLREPTFDMVPPGFS